jgi:hypothetical protein
VYYIQTDRYTEEDMPSVSQYVEVDINLDDFDDQELIEEVEARGFYVSENDQHDIISIEYHWNRGNKKEALILLERKFPELLNISKLVD